MPVIVFGFIGGFFLPSAFGAEIPFEFVEDTTKLTDSTGSAWEDTTTMDIPSANFTTGRKYLIVASAFTYSSAGETMGIKLQHGTTDFPASIQELEYQFLDFGRNWLFFDVWTAVAGEKIQMQHKRVDGTGSLKLDNMMLFAMEISEELTENTDWFYDENFTKTDLSSTWSTTNNAKIEFTPSETQDYLIMALGWLNNTDTTNQQESRLRSTGTIGEEQPLTSQESEKSSDIHVQPLIRTFTLDSEANTFEQQSRVDSGTLPDRFYSKVFGLRLDAFNQHNFGWNETQSNVNVCVGWACVNSDDGIGFNVTASPEGNFYWLVQNQ